MNPKAKVLTLIPNAVPKKYHNVASESNLLYDIKINILLIASGIVDNFRISKS